MTVLEHLLAEEKVPWHYRDFAYKMIKRGLIDDEFLNWGKPFAKGSYMLEREKDLPTGKGVFIKACHKSLEHNIPKLLEVPNYSFHNIKPSSIKVAPDIISKMHKRYSKGPVNDEKHKPTTNQALLDESNEHTKTREK